MKRSFLSSTTPPLHDDLRDCTFRGRIYVAMGGVFSGFGKRVFKALIKNLPDHRDEAYGSTVGCTLRVSLVGDREIIASPTVRYTWRGIY